MNTQCPGCGQTLNIHAQGAECKNALCSRHMITRQLDTLLRLTAEEVAEYTRANEKSAAILRQAEEAIRADELARIERWLALGRSLDDYKRIYGSSHG